MDIAANQQLNTSSPLNTIRPPAVPYRSSYHSHVTQTQSSSADEENTVNQQREQQRAEQADAQLIQKLASRDREVRSHEAAHVAAGGSYIRGGSSFTYQRGPNGQLYAIGGEVKIDASAIVNNPEATLDKAEVVRRAALAPAQPSPEDLRVAAQATRLASRARIDIAIQQRQQQMEASRQGNDETEVSDTGSGSSGSVSGFTGTLESPDVEAMDLIA